MPSATKCNHIGKNYKTEESVILLQDTTELKEGMISICLLHEVSIVQGLFVK